MNEIELNDQYSLYYEKHSNGKIFVELHDFHNLEMFREFVELEEFEDMKNNPGKYI